MYKKLKNIRFYFILISWFYINYTNCFCQYIISDDKKNPISIIIGDSQHRSFLESLFWEFWGENNAEKTQKIFSEISAREPGIIIHLGDLTEKGSSESAWEDFDKDNKPVLDKKIPYYPVFGNHEYFGDIIKSYANFYKRFSHLKFQKWYDLRIGDIGFIMLNSNFEDIGKNNCEKQKQWFLSTLDKMEKDTGIKIILAFSHHPPYTNSTVVSPGKEVREFYAEEFIKREKTKIFFSGHCHSYEKFIERGKYFIVSGGGGGARQKLNINKETRKYDDKYEGQAIRFFHFCQMEKNKQNLILQVIKLEFDGSFSIADSIKIKY